MSPVTHFLVGWMVANGPGDLPRRDRSLIAIAGIAPDVDALGAIPEMLTRGWERPLLWFTDYHHFLGHNLPFCLLFTAGAALLAKSRRGLVAALVIVSFHLHLLCDILGGRGPDGHQWPIHYLAPFSRAWEWTWSGQWALNAWPNFAVTGACLAITLYLAITRGFSPVGIVSVRADDAFIRTLRARFGWKAEREAPKAPQASTDPGDEG